MKLKTLIYIILTFSVSSISAQDYFDGTSNRYQNQIFKENIKTPLLYQKGWEMSEPVIQLGTNEKLMLSFDDLDADEKIYNYTLIHCNADWTPSDLDPSEYLSSFYDDEIRDYQMSYNTLQDYVHYSLSIPNENIQPILSGNYILLVYENSPEDPSFSLRFRVLEQKIGISSVRTRKPSIINLRETSQQVQFIMQAGNYSIPYPQRDLKTCIVQNGRPDNVIWLQLREIRENEYYYDPTEGNIFNGGNEFRNFDMKSLKFYSEAIAQIKSDNNSYDITLHPGEIRRFKDYESDRDLNGNFLIKNDEAFNSDIESEYVHVHFSLPYDAPLVDGSLYIFGKLTNWQFTNQAKMKYNYETKTYEASLFLKQGYYNYVYAFLPNNASAAEIPFIEGNFFDADNDYAIYVYHREPGDRYDRLIGSVQFNSHYNNK